MAMQPASLEWSESAAAASERVSDEAVGEPRPSRFGPRTRSFVEFLVVGGATLVLFPLSYWARSLWGEDWTGYYVSFFAFYAAYVINDPHFAVTYLLFYRGAKERALGGGFQGAQRIRYLVAGFVVPFVLVVWAAVGLSMDSPMVLSGMIQLMFLLVGWHYVKQGFGVLTVLSARRGVRLSDLERRAVLVHCFAAWAHAWVNPAGPPQLMEENGVVYASFGLPVVLDSLTQAIFWGSGVVMLFVLAREARRQRRFLPIVPLTGLLISVWLWTVYTNVDPLMMYVIPGLHSIQYLYFVWLLRRNEARAFEGEPHFQGSVKFRLGVLAVSALVLGFVILRSGPGLLDQAFPLGASMDPKTGATLGATPFLAAFTVFVNIHHYFMDHVIWRRENPETRFLRG